ncbi:hypothetical protein [Bacillus sp. FSL K6-3431]|uniref:hypothetical protein n=1 Tax=Bacillus sp. FSL K6-3431 TaxID=2921500 RepID=UPI0030F8611E
MKLLTSKRSLYFLSLIATIILSFIPGIGIRIEEPYRHFGFPAQWLGYYGGGQFSFELLGLLLNFFVFYFVLVLLNKLRKVLFEVQK